MTGKRKRRLRRLVNRAARERSLRDRQSGFRESAWAWRETLWLVWT